MRIVVGADHGGDRLKEEIARFLAGEGYEVEDVGTFDEESTDYPDYAVQVARVVA
ncbi:MAG TPA: RpiB/LacA/LacB family sugar-phosphate isomerase, partial [Anaerolineales bacterium]|nr:RpiB/LacA/LacB family sugar-phosphate isomerase [Anaerolineales bacterium]